MFKTLFAWLRATEHEPLDNVLLPLSRIHDDLDRLARKRGAAAIEARVEAHTQHCLAEAHEEVSAEATAVQRKLADLIRK